jgi:hypothetical protein
MRSSSRVVVLTLGYAGWVVLAGCHQGQLTVEQKEQTPSEPGAKAPAEPEAGMASTRPVTSQPSGDSPTSLPASDPMLKEVLDRYEAVLEDLMSGTGEMDIAVELFQEKPQQDLAQYIHRKPGQTMPSDDILREVFAVSGLDPNKGWFRGRIHWWFKGDKTRSDRLPGPLLEGEMALQDVPWGRLVYNGQIDISAVGPTDPFRQTLPPDRIHMVYLRGHSNPSNVGWLVSETPYDFRNLLLPFASGVRAHLANLRGENARVSRTAERQGELIVITIGRPVGVRWTTYTFDPRQGCQIVKAESFSDSGRTRTLEWEAGYQKIGQQWFPGHIRLFQRRITHPTASETRETRTRFTAEFSHIGLGHRIEDTLFTLAGMDIPTGTRIFDQRILLKPKWLRYDPEATEWLQRLQQKPASDQKESEPTSSRPSATRPADGQSTGFRAKHSDPREFIKLRFVHGIPYATVKRELGEKDLPLLHEMLRDPVYFANWSEIAQLIGVLGNSPASVLAIEEYVSRQEDWSHVEAQTSGERAVSKTQALVWVGMIGGDHAEKLLRRAITEDGARDLGKAWLAEAGRAWPKTGEDRFVGMIRGSAATALVYLGREPGVNMVADLYETEHQRCKAARESTELYSNLVDAMATRDLIRKMGREAYFNSMGTRKLDDAITPFIRKYSWRYQVTATGASQ